MLAVSLFICLAVVHTLTTFPIKPVEETPKSMVKKIPPDVKKEYVKQKAIASISAVLRVPILLYHYVEYVQDKRDTIRQSLDIVPSTFESQVQTLSAAGYTFLTARDLADILDGITPLPPKPVLLTFDDGHWDFDTVVLPILKKYNVKATAYIISGFLGGSDFMSPAQLQDVINSGLVEIGAHTVHHIALRGRSADIVAKEINDSKNTLEQTYHVSVVSFAYPDGSFDQQAINLVEAGGFRTAVSTIPGIDQSQANRFFLFRLRPGYRTGQQLLNYLEQSTFQAY